MSKRNNKITNSPMKFDLSGMFKESVEYKLSMDVETNAEFQANPVEWFGKAFIETGSRSNFRLLAGIKTKTKLAVIDTADVLKEYGCPFVAGDINLDAINIDVCPVTIQKGFCQSEVEQSFLGEKLGKGSNGNITTQEFLNYLLDRLAKKASEEIELMTWQGNTAVGEATGFLALCDGLEVKLSEDTDVLTVTAGSVTAANVVAELNKVVALIPSAVRFKKDLAILVSSNVMSAFLTYYMNTIAPQFNGLSTDLQMNYAGIKLMVAEGMSDNTMVAALVGAEGDLIYATDVDTDISDLRVVDFSKTTLDDTIGIRANAKVGFYYTNPEQIVFYSSLV